MRQKVHALTVFVRSLHDCTDYKTEGFRGVAEREGKTAIGGPCTKEEAL